jgi:hypothetical protein
MEACTSKASIGEGVLSTSSISDVASKSRTCPTKKGYYIVDVHGIAHMSTGWAETLCVCSMNATHAGRDKITPVPAAEG